MSWLSNWHVPQDVGRNSEAYCAAYSVNSAHYATLILLRHELSPPVDDCIGSTTWTARQDFDERADQMHAHGRN
jgi:hypothetical protein